MFVFSRFDIAPLASASVAQVHAAKLKTGEEVVVKVVRPGLKPIIGSDLAWLFILAKTAERNRDNALFVGFAPAEDPQIVISVMIENGELKGVVKNPNYRGISDQFWADPYAFTSPDGEPVLEFSARVVSLRGSSANTAMVNTPCAVVGRVMLKPGSTLRVLAVSTTCCRVMPGAAGPDE